jgi:NitT/TauT family transport system substrate-binding protein/putative hydroxymethylpyrimidine transport system substrate-binding protein
MPIVNHPLAAVHTLGSIRRPRELEGKTVGVTGAPSDRAILHMIVKADGGDFKKVKTVTLGHSGLKALVTRKIDGLVGFWSKEGVYLRQKHQEMREFRIESFGAPAYPELVLAVTRKTLQSKKALVTSTVAALRRGYAAVRKDPDRAIAYISKHSPPSDQAVLKAESKTLAQAKGSLSFNPEQLDKWASWVGQIGVVKERPKVSELLTANP